MLLAAKRLLGGFSVVLGLAAVWAPRRFGRMLGLDADAQAISAFGAREIAAGAGLLSPVRPGPWLWLRVGGDIFDLVALVRANRSSNPHRQLATAALGVAAAVCAIDLTLAVTATLRPQANRRAAA